MVYTAAPTIYPVGSLFWMFRVYVFNVLIKMLMPHTQRETYCVVFTTLACHQGLLFHFHFIP